MHQACSEPTMMPVRMVKKTPLSATAPGQPARRPRTCPGAAVRNESVDQELPLFR